MFNSPKWIANRLTLFQFFITLIFSLIPVILAFITIFLTEDKAFKNIADQVLGNGELVIYSATLLAPVLYTTYKDPPVKYTKSFNLIAWGIVLITAVFYPLFHLGLVIKDPFVPSLWLTAFVLLLIYVNMFLEHLTESKVNAPKATQVENEQFKANFRQYRGD